MKIRFYLTIGVLFLLAGVLLNSQQFIQYVQAKGVQPAQTTNVKNQNIPAPEPAVPVAVVSGEPIHISLPSLDISLDIKPGYYDSPKQTWTLSDTYAHFATVTAPPNNRAGNTFIYGHNKEAVFKKLLAIKVGDTAVITTANNRTFTYTFTGQKTTSPNDVSLLHYKGSPILTLQTCSGVFYQNRQLFTFAFTGVQ